MPARRLLIAAWAVALLLALPVRAAAQKSAFIDAFIDFHSALYGTYGDEGPRVTLALERMAASLDTWERTAEQEERALRARAGTTPAALALAYADRHRLDDAASAIRDAIAAEPRRPALHVFHGLLEQARGHAALARRAFETARALDPADPVAAYLVAASTTGNSDPAQIRALASTMMGATSGFGPRSRPFATFALVSDLSSTTPMFAPPLYAAGFEALAAGRLRDALEQFRAAAAQDPLVTDAAAMSPQLLAGVRALREKRGADAIRHVEGAVAALPDSPLAHRVLGVVYRASNRLPDAIAQFEMAARLADRTGRARVALGGTLLEASRPLDAERVLRETIAALPLSGDARWALADVYERLDRGKDAEAALEPATSLTVVAGKAQLYWRMAQLAHLYRRDYARVIDLTARRAWLLLNEPHAHKDLGMAHYRAGREDAALVELLMATLLGLEDGEMLGAIGQLHLAAERLDMAERTLRRAVALAPELPHPHYVLGMTLRRLDRVKEADDALATFKRLQAAAFDKQQREFQSELGAAAPRR
jgi:tetratricopeptide (TPR) repeat protein